MEPSSWPAPGDAVSRLLDGLRWTATGYARQEIVAGADRAYAGATARFHSVVSGTATMTDPSGPMRLRSDDVLLALRGGGYVIRADTLLSRDGASVARTALALGYTSEAAFSRAFRRIHGRPPSVWRQSAR